MTKIAIKLIPAYEYPYEINKLFSEYTHMLVTQNEEMKNYLTIQNYSGELENLERIYGLPEGRLYLAYYDSKLAGCIGLKKLDNHYCEMKRLYVRPVFRRKHVGAHLIEKIIEDARQIGYKHILLDTLPSLKAAVVNYKKHGFYEIENYNDNPIENSIYMQLDL
ncbi:GNAT family N-acetyltransferase [Tetragenococcus halophilus]|uniref:GNAT family N-acetyltransferase n=1 Tax=Tetragenococcus halophilus TaxID=51669 RepID=UPI000CC4CD40|nr:GNAT family N-acetyltransferase [Tetragenococcus halophilus]MDN6669144.1 GNAT family N-acetyltransferase [Tetragenococcus koreensis]GBD64786.1 putative acetyltransferase [Tetragenococcus halophilus subsp. flandriensis]GEQ39049.1 N-acetyltransferase [Tetragenococcus halophilus]GEQ43556.1 N-acetyltransferase [Tetragenococcus halophilus]GMG64768.1 GNAT family N-acetyltransferase [Tetragenococcus halophilus]